MASEVNESPHHTIQRVLKSTTIVIFLNHKKSLIKKKSEGVKDHATCANSR